MKNFFYKIMLGILALILIPIVFTLLLQGSGDNFLVEVDTEQISEGETEAFDEEILPGILAREIDIKAETEAMKAQAVIARTNCLRAMKAGEEMPKSLNKNDMIKLWGQDNFEKSYQQIKACVNDTAGVAMVFQGEYIKADYHSVSAGATRNAQEVYQTEDFPYLCRQECLFDIPAEDFLKVQFFSTEEFLEKGTELAMEELTGKTSDEILAAVLITKRDSADYATELSVNGKIISGEKFRLAYGLNSACFNLKSVEGKIRIVTKGFGHGLGLSLYGANALAAKGKDYRSILQYFYKEIEFVTYYH